MSVPDGNATGDMPVPLSVCRSSARQSAELPNVAESSRTQIRLGKGKAIDIDESAVSKVDQVYVVQDAATCGFFSKELRVQRRQYIVIALRPVVLIIILMWLCLPVFWGALANSPKRTSSLEAHFINRDAGRIGNGLWDVFSNQTAPGQHLGWVNIDPGIAGSNQDIINAIVHNQAWIAVVIEANATTRLSRARANGDTSYDPRSAITVYYAQARQEVAVGTYVLPITTQLLTTAVTAYTTSSAQRYFAQITPGDTVNATAVGLLAQAPQTISPGIAWTMVNVRPYTSPDAQAVTLVGNIFLIIFAFIATMGHCAARAVVAPRLSPSSYMILRLIVPLIIYIPLSMSYTLISLAFDLPFGAKYSYGGGFMLTFVFVYLGMAALGLALEAMITILTPKFAPFFLFILIIFNIAPVLLPTELMHPFYIYGTGFPIWNLSQAFRTILFNTHCDLGRNAGVMIAWISLSCFTLLLFTWLWQQRELVMLSAVHVRDTPLPALPHKSEANLKEISEEKCL